MGWNYTYGLIELIGGLELHGLHILDNSLFEVDVAVGEMLVEFLESCLHVDLVSGNHVSLNRERSALILQFLNVRVIDILVVLV